MLADEEVGISVGGGAVSLPKAATVLASARIWLSVRTSNLIAGSNPGPMPGRKEIELPGSHPAALESLDCSIG